LSFGSFPETATVVVAEEPEGETGVMEPMTTQRLVLRNYRDGDWADLLDIVRHDSVRAYEPDWVPTEAACREAAAGFTSDDRFIAMESPVAGKVVGHLYLSPAEPEVFRAWDLGFILHPSWQGKGYAAEACRAVLDWTFGQRGARRVVARCCPQNERSWRLMERIGMRREGWFREAVTMVNDAEGRPVWWDELVYAVLRTEWAHG
jgi:[ribosomal protein S5]-alanine N-acetyltransferase